MRRTVRFRVDFGRRKRAEVLLLLGVIFVINGYVIADTASTIGRSPIAAQSYRAHLDVMPMHAWGLLMIVVGFASATAALFRGLPAWLGYAGLQLFATTWAGLFVVSYASTGYGRAWLGALQWAAIVGILVIVSDWEDPPAVRLDHLDGGVEATR